MVQNGRVRINVPATPNHQNTILVFYGNNSGNFQNNLAYFVKFQNEMRHFQILFLNKYVKKHQHFLKCHFYRFAVYFNNFV